jgi:hypothetical protein
MKAEKVGLEGCEAATSVIKLPGGQ